MPDYRIPADMAKSYTSIPTQGYRYIVNSQTETLRDISRQAYGRDLSNLLTQANLDKLAPRGRSLEGLPIIYKGDDLFIPNYKNRYNNETVTADFDTQIEVRLNGTKIPGAVAGRINRQMNTIANGFTLSAPFDYMDNDQLDLFRPFGWQKAQLYIGGELYITALASKWDFSTDDNGVMATIECRTMPGEMLECMGMRPKMQFKKGLRLIDICVEVARPYGITCYASDGGGGIVEAPPPKKTKKPENNIDYAYDDDGYIMSADAEDMDNPLGLIEQDYTQTDADFLQELAKQKGFLLTSMADGNLLLTRANIKDKAVCALRQGEYPVISVSGSYDGSKRFSKWQAVSEKDGQSGISKTLEDKTVPVPRGFVFKATEADDKNITAAVNWRMAKSIADSISIPVTVAGWRNVEGELWKENVVVTLFAPGAFVIKEVKMITESVELSKDESGGDIANLQLVIPESYTTTMPKEPFPWSGRYSKSQASGSGGLEYLK